MPILELYSTRNKDIYPDAYKYNQASQKLRVQLVKIIFDSFGMNEEFWHIGRKYGSAAHFSFRNAFDLISKEYGTQRIHGYESGCHSWVEKTLLEEPKIERLLDLLEVLCTMLLTHVQRHHSEFVTQSGSKQEPKDAVDEINERMKRDGFGFEYLDGVIIRIDQEFLHSEVTKPALFLMSQFEGARQELAAAKTECNTRPFR